MYDGGLDVVTHYFLLELGPDQMDCETKEMSGGGGWVGSLVGGGFDRFGWEAVCG